ncbi:hypothetical protein DFQ28_007777 [Apophysomyces sp. BC1034]|nr:hypothetical protein DFQ30_007636 [Apophysomyces sp. BC1015]KAG0176091.1 hypothetical protein DFQ29_006553 [Apophysomyces sp. BC1021]KAG0186429.1 hypothetical protein DFQ28_007777 [Apophysomyces sp. BC1034]
MPFPTIGRDSKRFRVDLGCSAEEDEDTMDHLWSSYQHPTDIYQFDKDALSLPYSRSNEEPSHLHFIPTSPSSLPPLEFPTKSTPIDIPSTTDIGNITATTWNNWASPSSSSSSPTKALVTPSSPALESVDFNMVHDALSRFNLSYTDVGINMEANINSASDLRSLIDAFSKLCCTTSLVVPPDPHRPSQLDHENEDEEDDNLSEATSIVLYRNKSHKTKPVNFFASVSLLGQILNPHPKHRGRLGLRQIADACIETYFSCWVRYTPVLRRDDFMAWYNAHHSPTDTLIVNAVCSYVFGHMVAHHAKTPGLTQFLNDQDKLREQEEFFFNRARDCLAQSFDSPDRFTIVALMFMGARAEPSRRHHYAGMAVSALHGLEIYPRMVDEEAESFDKEMDTRLWWWVWAMDLYLYSSGTRKNTPQPRWRGQVDLPRVFEQDIDEGEIGIVAYIHCLRIWRIQAEIIQTIYEQDSEMTVEQLRDYDRRMLHYYDTLPSYLQFDSGFEYGCEDLFLACVRVNIEYNATRIILHKSFIPELNDPRPSLFSLQSLNISLSTALTQLRALNTCNRLSIGRCAFDRDELWRAAEIISTAMDIMRTCLAQDDRDLILRNIKLDEFQHGLEKTLEILRATREYKTANKNFIQVADWLHVEIRRHELYAHPNIAKLSDHQSHSHHPHQYHQHEHTVKPDYFLAHLKPRSAPPAEPEKKLPRRPRQPSKDAMTSVLAFGADQRKNPFQYQHQFNHTSAKPSRSKSSPSISELSTSAPSPSSPSSFIHFNAYDPHQGRRSSTASTLSATGNPNGNNGKNQPRFRYFNPRKMNKFLFIDEHPMQ